MDSHLGFWTRGIPTIEQLSCDEQHDRFLMTWQGYTHFFNVFGYMPPPTFKWSRYISLLEQEEEAFAKASEVYI